MANSIKVSSEVDILFSNIDFRKKLVIDVGCGDGNISRFISGRCKFIYGIDTPEIINKTLSNETLKNVQFKCGVGQELPFDNSFADVIIFIASFHHIPENYMIKAIVESKRVLKNKGQLCFLEPVAKMNSYYELLRIIDDESEIQKKAYKTIKNASYEGFDLLKKAYYYMLRNFTDFENLVTKYVHDELERTTIFEMADNLITLKNLDKENVKWKSYCRLILLKKNNF